MKGVVANRSMGWWKASLEGSAILFPSFDRISPE
jgi:hypothetical protein